MELGRMEEWATRKLMKFSKDKWEVLDLLQNNPVQAGDWPAGELLCRKRPGSPSAQAEHGTSRHP